MSQNALDVKTIASRLGTEGRFVRRYLRSASSSFKPVGTGNQYRFRELDFPTIEKEFRAYQNRSTKADTSTTNTRKKKSAPAATQAVPIPDPNVLTPEQQEALDLLVWEEEEEERQQNGDYSVAEQMLLWNSDADYRSVAMAELQAQEERLLKLMAKAGLKVKNR